MGNPTPPDVGTIQYGGSVRRALLQNRRRWTQVHLPQAFWTP